MQLIKGTELSEQVKREVMAAFPYQPKKDAEWLASYAFYVTKFGHLAQRPGHCVPVNLMDVFAETLR